MTAYDILEVSVTASVEEIRDAYRLLISMLHPDKFPQGSRQWSKAHEKTVQINKAYEILKNPQRRKAYDEWLIQQKKSAKTNVSSGPSSSPKHSDYQRTDKSPSTPVPKLIYSRQAHKAPATAVAFSRNNEFLATASADGEIMLWNATTGSHRRTVKPASGMLGTNLSSLSRAIYALTFSPNSETLVSGGANGTGYWDLKTGGQIRKPSLYESNLEVRSIAFSPDGENLLIGTGRLQTAINTTRRVLAGAALGSVTGIGALNGAAGAATIPKGGLMLLDVKTGKIKLNFKICTNLKLIDPGPTLCVTSVAFSPAGTFVAAANNRNTVDLCYSQPSSKAEPWWNKDISLIKTGEAKAVLECRDVVNSIEFTSDGYQLAVATCREIQLWDIERQMLLWSIIQEDLNAIAVASSPKIVASGGNDGMVRLWNLQTGMPLHTIALNGVPVSSVQFSVDGTKLAATDYNGHLFLWTI